MVLVDNGREGPTKESHPFDWISVRNRPFVTNGRPPRNNSDPGQVRGNGCPGGGKEKRVGKSERAKQCGGALVFGWMGDCPVAK